MGNAFLGVQRRQISQDKGTVSEDLLEEAGPEEELLDRKKGERDGNVCWLQRKR